MTPFFKYTGAGNDFVLFEDKIPGSVPDICDRKRGIGADGVLLLNKKGHSHYQMRIFNSDGSEAEMCGNGLRAFFSHLLSRFPDEAPFKVDSLLKSHKGWNCPDGEIEIEMGQAEIKAIKQSYNEVLCDLIDTGVPHLVLLRNSLNQPFLDIAPGLRHHPALEKGANVNLVENNANVWKVSTFERGVEGVTDACGTGVVAAALSLALHEGLSPPLTLLTPGGDLLTVSWKGNPKTPEHLTLKGKTALVFCGHWL